MVELRWLVRPIKITMPDGYVRSAHVEKVLQYRQVVDKASYAGIGPFPDSSKNLQWSDWMDVPQVQEELP